MREMGGSRARRAWHGVIWVWAVAFAASVGAAPMDTDRSNELAAGSTETTASAAVPARPDPKTWPLPLGLESFGPSAFGHTKNNDDVAFYNVDISVKFPLLAGFLWGKRDRFYFAFTGAFGFYVGTRDSGPVVGKEYNPQFFWQHEIGCDRGEFRSKAAYGDSQSRHPDFPCYFTIGYNHDSNGQSIAFPNQYLQAQRSQGTEAANDALSRGWDFIGFTGKYVLPGSTGNYRIALYPELKYFLADGLLQGRPEELHYWEHPLDGKPRKAVDGVGLLAKFQFRVGPQQCRAVDSKCFVGDGKLAVRYVTGYQNMFQYTTVRIEAGIHILDLPIVFWAQRGYMSDLSQYYRNVRGYGVEIEIGAF